MPMANANNPATAARFSQRRVLPMGFGLGLTAWNVTAIASPNIAARKVGVIALDSQSMRESLRPRNSSRKEVVRAFKRVELHAA